MNEPIHVAITRRIKPGQEAEFEQALKEFFQASFRESGVHGASMLVPAPGSSSSEFGILRTFSSARERDAFYRSPLFQAWEKRVQPLTVGVPVYRQLNGLEAWFRSAQGPPPRWKMALLTWLAVWPVSLGVSAVLSPLIGQRLPGFLFAGVAAAGIVIVLTWLAMPLLVAFTKGWLHPN